jgi:hypothetical protein
MFAVDDPLLSLILRFVTDRDDTEEANRQFLQLQVQALRQHLLRFPEEEHGERAMEWVTRHAEQYRKDWQRRTLSRESFALRCEDCPMRPMGASAHCEIHEQWLFLLRQYMLGETRSRDYVEQSLALLRLHKESLAVRTGAPRRGRHGAAGGSGGAQDRGRKVGGKKEKPARPGGKKRKEGRKKAKPGKERKGKKK